MNRAGGSNRRLGVPALCCALFLLLCPWPWPARGETTVYSFVNRSFLRPGEVRLVTDGQYFQAAMDLIDTARQELRLAMFLFKVNAGRNNRPSRLADALIRAQRRGVRVTVLLERSARDEKINRINRQAGRWLKANGVRVRYDSPAATMHAKFLVADRRRVLVGSHNLTHAALKYNREVSLLIDSPELAGKLLRYFNLLPQGD